MSHSREQVVQALARHHGIMKYAAEDLGLTRQALYRTMRGLEILPDEWGGHSGHGGHDRVRGHAGQNQNPRVRLTEPGLPPTFSNVSALESPARKLANHRTVTVLPEHFELLKEAKWDLQARLRKDFSEASVLGMFIAEMFHAWLDRKKHGAGPSQHGEPELDLDRVMGPKKEVK